MKTATVLLTVYLAALAASAPSQNFEADQLLQVDTKESSSYASEDTKRATTFEADPLLAVDTEGASSYAPETEKRATTFEADPLLQVDTEKDSSYVA